MCQNKNNLMMNLVDACLYDDLANVKKYIVMGADVNGIFERSYPLFVALAHERFDIFDFLIQHGADINKYSGLLQAAIATDVDNYYTKIYDYNDSRIKEPELKYTEFVIRNGADVNLIYESETSLDTAIRMKHLKAEKLLRSLGAKTSKDLEEENKKSSN